MQQNNLGGQKLLKLFGHFSITLLLLGTILSAQSFSEFKRNNEQSFKTYKDERDIAFSKDLKQQFEAYKSQKIAPSYNKKKPNVIEKANPKVIQIAGPKISIKLPVAKEIVKTVVKTNKIIKDKAYEEKDINIDFFGTKIGLNIDSQIKSANFHPKNQQGINNFFDAVASSDYENLITYVKQTSTKLNLNAWGIYILVKNISEASLSDKDNSKLLTWFILNKIGYRVKVGLSSSHIVLMHYSKKTIYAKALYRFDNEKYYVVSPDNNMNQSRIYSYKYNYPDATKDLDLSLKTLPKFEEDLRKKSLKYKKHTINYEYNQNLINFMKTYPQADYETFFNAPIDSITYKGLVSSIKKIIRQKQASTAINFILNFVQHAFIYEVDTKQFGYEKVMFAQETLYYDKSDCEDRAILFSYLVTKLFKYSIVGVKYKDHMATAIYIPLKGDSVNIESKKYIIADPTYVNASIGQSMPRYRSIKPEKFIKVFKN